jgi:hypothetical protein
MHRTSSVRRLALVTCGMLAAASQTGCVVAAAGGAAYGAYKYATNEVHRDFPADLATTWQATLAALQENGLPAPASAAHGTTSGEVTVGGTWVRVEAHAQGFTRVRVRVGTFETDEHRRRGDLILAAVARRLGA